MGMLYKRGEIWWIKYYQNGKCYRESSKSNKKMVAKKFLEQREGEIAQGKIPGIHFDKVKFDELAEEFLSDYRINQRKSLDRAKRSLNHLKEVFSGTSIPHITTARIKNYIESRLAEGAANATINRELAALKRMLNLGAKSTPPKVDRVPHIPMLKENNVRKGFFEHWEFVAFRDALPDYFRGVVTFAYKTGWRETEIFDMQWSQVDMMQGIVRLNPGETKNDDGRTVYLDGELKKVFRNQWELRKRKKILSTYVFPNKDGSGRIGDFRVAWEQACTEGRIGKRLFHDFRRTAIRNMIRAGIPERVAMMISGHKTRSVFDRYNIVNDSDLKLAASKQEEFLNGVTGTPAGTIEILQVKKERNRKN